MVEMNKITVVGKANVSYRERHYAGFEFCHRRKAPCSPSLHPKDKLRQALHSEYSSFKNTLS